MRIAYAGDRSVAVAVLDYLLWKGVKPVALLTPPIERASHAQDLIKRCDHLHPTEMVSAAGGGGERWLELMDAKQCDYLLSVHYPFIYTAAALEIPRIAPVNLHPAYLPYNRGWHTPTWAIVEGTPFGATLHIMTAKVDKGGIIARRQIEVRHDDTADSLYKRVCRLEIELFIDCWPKLATGDLEVVEELEEGTYHGRAELDESDLRRLELEGTERVGDLLQRLRALTTNRIVGEAAFFDVEGERYYVRVEVLRKSSLS